MQIEKLKLLLMKSNEKVATTPSDFSKTVNNILTKKVTGKISPMNSRAVSRKSSLNLDID